MKSNQFKPLCRMIVLDSVYFNTTKVPIMRKVAMKQGSYAM